MTELIKLVNNSQGERDESKIKLIENTRIDQAQPPVSLWKSSWLSCWLLSLLLIERKM